VLAKFKGRVVGGRALVKATGHTKNGIAWRAQRVEPIGRAEVDLASLPEPPEWEPHVDA
jgi:hypothetical protein